MLELLLEHLERLKRIPIPKPTPIVIGIGAGVLAGLNIIVHGTKVVINYLDRHFDRADKNKQEIEYIKEVFAAERENDIIRQDLGLSPRQERIHAVPEQISKPAVPVLEPATAIPPVPAVPVPPVDEHPFTQFLRLHLRPRPANHPIHYDSDHNELLNVFEALR